MAFIQGNDLQQVAPANPGNVQIVRKNTIPTVAGVAEGISAAGDIIDKGATVAGRSVAEDIYQQSAQQALAINESDLNNGEQYFNSNPELRGKLSREQANFNQFMQDNPDFGIDLETFNTLKTAKANGKLTGDAAKLLAASKARAAMRENPLLAPKIREAASSLIGFNVNTAGAQFVINQLNAQASAGSSGPKTQQEKWLDKAQAIVAAGLYPSVEAAYNAIAQQEVYSIKTSELKSKVELNMLSTEDAIATELSDPEMVQTRYTNVSASINQAVEAAKQEGRDVSVADITKAINDEKTAYIGSIVERYKVNSLDQRQSLQKSVDELYAPIEQYYRESKDPVQAAKLQVELLTSQANILAAENLPTYFALSRGVGQQVASDYMQLVMTSRTQQQLKTKLKNNPQLADLVGGVETMSSAISKMAIPASANPNYTEQETKFLRSQPGGSVAAAWAQENFKSIPEEARDTVLDTLQAAGHNLKTIQVLSTNRFSTSDKQRDLFKRLYPENKTVAINNASDLLTRYPNTDIIFNNETGKFEISREKRARGRRFKDNISQEDMRTLDSAVNTLNIYKTSADQGWTQEMGVLDTNSYIRNITSELATKVEDKRLGEEANRAEAILKLEELKNDPNFTSDWANFKSQLKERLRGVRRNVAGKKTREMLTPLLNRYGIDEKYAYVIYKELGVD